MKMIQEGNLDKLKQVIRFQCDDCDCIFEANHNEYEIKEFYIDTYYVCECPCCGNRVLKFTGEK